MRVSEGVVEESCGDESGGMRHIDHKDSAYLVGDVTDALVVPLAGIGRGTCDDEFGALGTCFGFEFVVIDESVVGSDAVVDSVEDESGEVDR